MVMKKDFQVFKSEEGRKLILRSYGRLLDTVGFRYQERYVHTSFGRSYVLEAGDPTKPAVVLIHGSCSNSAAWFGDIPTLIEHYHVFSIDVVGDAGNSEENRLDQKTEEFPEWLNEVFNGLEIEDAALIGNSLGGWIALQFAGRFPERINKLVLIAASGLVPVKSSFIIRTLLYLTMGEKGRSAISRMIFGSDEIPEAVSSFTSLVGEHFNPLTGALPVLTHEQMLRLTMPLIYIAGENDAITDTKKAAQRLHRLIPRAEAYILENCGHVIYDAKPWYLPFLAK
jgi:pimeloyl-ACP methyl ester carboxylesterase